MTDPIISQAIGFCEYVAEKYADTIDDSVAQRARYHARKLAELVLMAAETEAQQRLREIHRLSETKP